MLHKITKRLEICIDINIEISQVDHYMSISSRIFRLALEITFYLTSIFCYKQTLKDFLKSFQLNLRQRMILSTVFLWAEEYFTNYIQLYTKTSKKIYNHVRDCYQNSVPQPSKTEQFNQPVFLKRIIRRSRLPDDSRQKKSPSIGLNSSSIRKKFQQQFPSMQQLGRRNNS